MIRTFIAIDIPEHTRSALETIEKKLQQAEAPVSWIKPDRIHLTLKFLGDVSPERIAEIQTLLRGIAASTRPFRLQPAGCGAFPTIKQMRVLWVGIRGDEGPLGQLHRQVDSAMASLGFQVEDRPFRAHLTLGRVKGRHSLRLLQETLTGLHNFEAEAFDVRDLVLYKSELRREGALYTPLFRIAFADGP